MVDKSMIVFPQLSEEEELVYRGWARSCYKTLDPIQGVWHPVVQDECVKMNMEKHMVTT